jgi:hypothetical protein
MLLNKKIVSALALISLVFSTGLYPVLSVKAAGLASASDVLSTSDVSVVATHTVTFTTNVSHSNSDYFEVVIAAEFGAVTSATNVGCPSGYSAAVPGAPSRTVQCISTGAHATGTYSITINGVTNPAAIGSYSVSIANYGAGAVLKENSNVLVAIVSSVVMSANVTSNLIFGIEPIASGTSINGVTTTAPSGTTTIAYGTLAAGSRMVIGQQVSVTTNAANGYSVTVTQDQDLTNASNAKINTFIDGTASTTAQSWVAPSAQLGNTNTYGHLGVTTNATSLSTGGGFGADKWKGLAGTTPLEVMYHNGPSNGSVQVAYGVQISTLQPAGDYSNALTYTATPSF